MTVVLQAAEYKVTANGATTAFPTGIYVDDAAEMTVYFRDAAGTETLQASGTYAVSLVGNAAGATVTFSSAPDEDQVILFVRAAPYKQTLDLQNQRGYSEEDLMFALDDIVQQVQQLKAKVDRSFLLSVGDGWPGLPVAAVRAGRVLSFDSSGAPTTSTANSFIADLGNALGAMTSHVFPVLADAINDSSLAAGDSLATMGYWISGDFGAAPYDVMTTAEYGGTPDGMKDHATVNGLVLKLRTSGLLFLAEQYGVRQNAECSARFNVCVSDAAAASEAAMTVDLNKIWVSCMTDFYTKDTLFIGKANKGVMSAVSFSLTCTITATTGGTLEDSTWAQPIPMMYWRATKGVAYFGVLDCNRICSGLLSNSAASMTAYNGQCYRFDRFGVANLGEQIDEAPWAYGPRFGSGAGGNLCTVNWNIKQWQQTDPEFEDDANYTGDCFVLGIKDGRHMFHNLGWSRTALLLLGRTPAVDLGVRTDPDTQPWQDYYIDGRTIYAGHRCEGAGDQFMTNLHLMQGRPDGPAREDNLANGGPINIECWNNTNLATITISDYDSGTFQIYAGGLRILYGSTIVGGRNRVSIDKVIIQHPIARVYADGTAQPSNFEMQGVKNISVGFEDFEGRSWTDDFDLISLEGRFTTTGYTGPVRYRGKWEAVAGADFPTDDVLAGDWWLVTGEGTEDVPVVVHGQDFIEGNTLCALVDAPSATVYAANWVTTVEGEVVQLRRGRFVNLLPPSYEIHMKSDTGAAEVRRQVLPPGNIFERRNDVGALHFSETFEDVNGTLEWDANIVKFKGMFANALGFMPVTPLVKNLGSDTAQFDKVYFNKLYLGSTSAGFLTAGDGSPEGVVSASVGSLYFRNNGSAGSYCYRKNSGSGNTGWSAIW